MKALQTWYNGHYFRSRKEARFAVFMDTAGIRWEYEQQGYADDEVAYLPDFWLPDIQVYVEVKPNGVLPSVEERAKATHLAADQLHAVFIEYGDITVRPDLQDCDSMECIGMHGFIDNQFWFCQCEHCGLVGIQWQGHADRLSCGCYAERGESKVPGYDTNTLNDARLAARSARFEHGQYGPAA